MANCAPLSSPALRSGSSFVGHRGRRRSRATVLLWHVPCRGLRFGGGRSRLRLCLRVAHSAARAPVPALASLVRPRRCRVPRIYSAACGSAVARSPSPPSRHSARVAPAAGPLRSSPARAGRFAPRGSGRVCPLFAPASHGRQGQGAAPRGVAAPLTAVYPSCHWGAVPAECPRSWRLASGSAPLLLGGPWRRDGAREGAQRAAEAHRSESSVGRPLGPPTPLPCFLEKTGGRPECRDGASRRRKNRRCPLFYGHQCGRHVKQRKVHRVVIFP